MLKELENRSTTLAICSNREENIVKGLTKEHFEEINFKYISEYREGVPDKPDPYRIYEIIKQEKVPKSEVLYFGDKDTDIKVAKNAGIDMVLVTYGQGSKKDFENDYPIKVIDKIEEILEI